MSKLSISRKVHRSWNSKMKQISIIGFGRFGKTLYKLLKDDFAVTLYNRSPITDKEALSEKSVITDDLSVVYRNEVIFYGVPISAFEQVVAEHRKYFRPEHLLIDVLSVKLHPAAVFKKHLKGQTRALLTHPMFGPDSSQTGFAGLPIVMNQFTANDAEYKFWTKFFASKGLNVLEMTPEEHDKQAANSQGLTHFLGRLLDEYHFE